jgi:hypothetical protein
MMGLGCFVSHPSSSEEGQGWWRSVKDRSGSELPARFLHHPQPPPLKRRGLVAFALVALAACSSGGEVRGEPFACNIAGVTGQTCKLERSHAGNSVQFVVHHPDGGFRRFVLAPDGKGIVPADGADAATSKVAEGTVDVAVGQDRYRIPQSLLEPTDEP